MTLPANMTPNRRGVPTVRRAHSIQLLQRIPDIATLPHANHHDLDLPASPLAIRFNLITNEGAALPTDAEIPLHPGRCSSDLFSSVANTPCGRNGINGSNNGDGDTRGTTNNCRYVLLT